jgi:hypothetical protein
MRRAALAAAALALGAGLLLARCVLPGHVMTAHAADTTASLPAIVYTATPRYDALAWMRGAERFSQGAVLMLDDGQGARPLVKDFAASADANVSPDGGSILFAGKKTAADHWQVWEIRLASEELKQVTQSPDDCVHPFYLAPGRIVYARHVSDRFVIEGLRMADGQIVRLTQAAAMPTDVLRDGRVLFEAGWPLGSGKTPEIYAVYSDGSGVEAYRCDHPSSAQSAGRYAARELISGDILFTQGRGLARFTSPLAHQVAVSAPLGEYAGEVAQLPSGEWLLPWRADKAKHFALVKWSVSTAASSNSLTPVIANTTKDLVEPAVLMVHATPKRHPTALHEWSYANLMALNVYTSREPMAAGKVATVRVFARDAAGNATVLGDAPVAKDGSFFVQVPGDRLIQFELRRADGSILRREHGWMWARSGEQRICVGCHAGPERAPDNEVPAILDISTEPTDLTGTHAVPNTQKVAGAKTASDSQAGAPSRKLSDHGTSNSSQAQPQAGSLKHMGGR